LLDATIGALSQSDGRPRARRRFAAAATSNSGSSAWSGRCHQVSPEVERLGRTLVRLTVDADVRTAGDEAPRRGYRRVEWIESALSPWRERIGPERWRRLVAALAMVVGWEALIVQRDVAGLSAREGEELSVWAARAFLNATLQELRTRRRLR
jgi:hypothetical protein